jgi:hypothetical protein
MKKIRLYYERGRVDAGLPWAVQVEEPGGIANYPAADVFFNVKTRTVFIENPDPKGQKYYVQAFGKVRWEGQVAIVD